MKKALLFVACSSCAHSIYVMDGGKPIRQCTSILYAIPSDTPEHLYKPILDAFKYWEEATGVDNIFVYAGVLPYPLRSPYTGGVLAVGVLPELEQRFSGSRPCGRTYMTVTYNGCIRKIRIELSKECANDTDEFQTVIRHEVGHALGLDDSSDFTALMSGHIEPTMQHPVGANEEEIRAVKALYNRAR